MRSHVSTQLGLQPRYSGDPAFVGNYRRALSQNLIVGGGVQISEDIQVVGFETQFVPQVIPGSFTLQGAAVANRLTSYNAQDVQYDIDTLNAGYDIGSGVVRVEPPYRSGYNLVIGNDRFVSAVGTLQIDGAPAALVTGLITSTDDEGFEPAAFFTNSVGRFGIIGLAPGRTYNVRLNDSGRTFVIRVPADNRGLYRLETVNLQNEAG